MNPMGGRTGTATRVSGCRSRGSNTSSTLQDPVVAAQVAHTVFGVDESNEKVCVCPAFTSANVGGVD